MRMDRLTNPNGDGFIAYNGCTKPMCTDCEEFKKQAALDRMEGHE